MDLRAFIRRYVVAVKNEQSTCSDGGSQIRLVKEGVVILVIGSRELLHADSDHFLGYGYPFLRDEPQHLNSIYFPRRLVMDMEFSSTAHAKTIAPSAGFGNDPQRVWPQALSVSVGAVRVPVPRLTRLAADEALRLHGRSVFP